MTRQAVFITLCLLLAVTTSCFGFVQALLGGCDDIEKDLRFEKLIYCGGTQSVQAKKHVEILKGQIDGLKKHRDRLELELDETQTSFRNLRYTETICQSNYSDIVQQLSEYKNRIASLQNENQAYQKTGGAGGTLQFYSDYSHVLLAVAVILVFSILLYINSLLEKVKHELREEAENRRSSNLQLTEKLRSSNLQLTEKLNKLIDSLEKTRKAKSVNKSENGELFSADDEDEEDEYEEEQQESNAEDEKIEDNAGSSESLQARIKPNHQASKPPKGGDETSASVSGGGDETSASVSGGEGETSEDQKEETIVIPDGGDAPKEEEESKENKDQENIVPKPASGIKSEENSSGREEEKECDPEAPPETPV